MGTSVTWVAEIGSAHQGDLSLAYELIRKAKWAGATIAKFQLGWTREAQEKYAKNYDERRYVDDWAGQLADWCREMGIDFMASIWSREGLETAMRIRMSNYKIAHQMDDRVLIQAIFDHAKHVYWSAPVEWKHLGSYTAINTQAAYPFYGRVGIPNFMGTGYSSHMHGIADALVAVARGADYIEKHVTLDKTAPFPRDNSFALLPEEFRTMVDVGNEMVALR